MQTTAAFERARRRATVQHAGLVQDAASAAMCSRRQHLPATLPKKPMLSPDTSLASVIDAYLADAKATLRPSTYQPRKSHLKVLQDLLEVKLKEEARGARRAPDEPRPRDEALTPSGSAAVLAQLT
jgi:hypothetical protein